MKISIKLFLILIGLTVFILATTLLLSRWSFERGFRDFYLGIETQRLETTAQSLSELYASYGEDWQAVPRRYIDNLLQGRRSGPPRGRPPRGERPPPREISSERTSALPGIRRPPPTVLYDTDGQVVAGLISDTTKDQITLAIVYNDSVIGELRSQPRPLVTWGLANAFSRQQTKTNGIIALLGIVLSAVISLFLTRHLLKPINSIRNKVSELTQGDYESEFNSTRKDELGELIKDIATLSSTLESTRKANKRWIADISHELRTPLTILTGEIEALRAGYRPLDGKALHSISQEVERLSHIVEDLYQLSLADIGGLKYHFEKEELNKSIQCVVDACLAKAVEKDIEIFFAPKVSVSALIDERRIEQLFLNLLNNSIAYTDSPGEIHISLDFSSKAATIAIEDSAPGIAAENCEQIFQPLFREDLSRARRGSGAGLGLSICQSIIEAHKGTIKAEPSLKGGLKVTIQLPAERTKDE